MGKNKPPERIRSCVMCGEVFERDHPRRITCSRECQRRRKNQMIAEWRARTECPDRAHGTVSGYATYQCACNACRKAERNYMRDRRAAQKLNA
jgi:hypothetical protein